MMNGLPFKPSLSIYREKGELPMGRKKIRFLAENRSKGTSKNCSKRNVSLFLRPAKQAAVPFLEIE